MRMRARHVDATSIPTAIRPYLGQTFLTTGKDYEVEAAAVFEGLVMLQVVDDLGNPAWRPAWLFDLVEPTIPGDWVLASFHNEPALVLGPAFIAESVQAYGAMVELQPDQVRRFWERVDARSVANGSGSDLE